MRDSSNVARFASQGAAIGDQVTIASFIANGDSSTMSTQLGTAKVTAFSKAAHGIILSKVDFTRVIGPTAGQEADATTTSGDSGGPLLNAKGEVVGAVSTSITMPWGQNILARYVNVQDPGPGRWLSTMVGADRLKVIGYNKGWFWDTPVQVTSDAASDAIASPSAAGDDSPDASSADDSDPRAKAAAAAQARADAAAAAADGRGR